MANFRHPWPTSAEALACRFHEGAVFTFPNALAPSPVWNTPLITRGLATHSLRMDRASNTQSRPVSLSHFPLEISGPQWVGRYPTSKSIGDLAPTFAKSVKSFIAPIQAGGGHVTVSATYRPPERAYLMHYAWAIAHGYNPSNVPPLDGVPIDWSHLNHMSQPDLKMARLAAQSMVAKYRMRFTAALKSRHTQRRAIDMTITHFEGQDFIQKNGSPQCVNDASELYALGATYGVVKLINDEPHWSDDGH